MPYGNRGWLRLGKQTARWFSLAWVPRWGSWEGSTRGHRFAALLPGTARQPDGEDGRQVGRATCGGERASAGRPQLPTGCLGTPPTPRTDADASAWVAVTGKPRTLTCLEADPLKRNTRSSSSPQTAPIVDGDLGWAPHCSSCLLRTPCVPGILRHSFYFQYNSHGDSSQQAGVGMIGLLTSQMSRIQRGSHHSRPCSLEDSCTAQSQAYLTPKSVAWSHSVILWTCASAEHSLNPCWSIVGPVPLSKRIDPSGPQLPSL